MDAAWELAEAAASHGTVVRTELQTRGRGRFSRRWVSDPSVSLLVSVVLKTPSIIVGPLLPVAATLAVRDAVQDVSGLDCAIKWPNDVHLDGRKIAGVLVEVRVDTRGEATAVLGVGLNVNLDLASHPELQETATSLLAATGQRHSLSAAAAALFPRLEETFAQMTRGDELVDRWRRSLDTLGSHVVVRQRDRAIEGIAEDVDGEGRLLLRGPDGTLHRLAEGDVSLREEAAG